MGKVGGFLEVHRAGMVHRDPAERVADYSEFVVQRSDEELAEQGGRCMECGTPVAGRYEAFDIKKAFGPKRIPVRIVAGSP